MLGGITHQCIIHNAEHLIPYIWITNDFELKILFKMWECKSVMLTLILFYFHCFTDVIKYTVLKPNLLVTQQI